MDSEPTPGRQQLRGTAHGHHLSSKPQIKVRARRHLQKARSLPAFAEPLEPGLQEVRGHHVTYRPPEVHPGLPCRSQPRAEPVDVRPATIPHAINGAESALQQERYKLTGLVSIVRRGTASSSADSQHISGSTSSIPSHKAAEVIARELQARVLARLQQFATCLCSCVTHLQAWLVVALSRRAVGAHAASF